MVVTHSSQWRYIISSIMRAEDFFKSGCLSVTFSPYFTCEMNAIFFSSGEITNPSTPSLTLDTHLRLLPSASITNTCMVSPFLPRNAIFLPPSIQASLLSENGVRVSLFWSEPSAFITHSSRLPLSSSMLSYATP